MTATDTQVRIIMRERRKGKTQEQAAAKANLNSRKTVRKYERLVELPGELKKAREYRTRNDPFEDDYHPVSAHRPGFCGRICHPGRTCSSA